LENIGDFDRFLENQEQCQDATVKSLSQHFSRHSNIFS
jgi:hypothetical protein